MPPAQQPRRRRHIPQRTCIICRRVAGKRDLIRIVRTADQGVIVDPTGKRNGRGAYLCRDKACWQKALRSQALERHLKTTLQEQDLAALHMFAAALPDEFASTAGPLLADAT